MRRRSRISRTSRTGARSQSQNPGVRRTWAATRSGHQEEPFSQKKGRTQRICGAPPDSWLLLKLLQLLDLLICLRLIFERKDSPRGVHSLQEMHSPQDLDSDLRISVPPTS